jgi:hypothetical protein
VLLRLTPCWEESLADASGCDNSESWRLWLAVGKFGFGCDETHAWKTVDKAFVKHVEISKMGQTKP